MRTVPAYRMVIKISQIAKTTSIAVFCLAEFHDRHFRQRGNDQGAEVWFTVLQALNGHYILKRMDTDRFQRQIQFILEVDKLKTILRRTYLIHEERSENTAEHSWHLAIMAILLAEHANEPVDVACVMKMVLVHDIVEIDAGDTYFYDTAAALDKSEREHAAAARLFGILPPDQGNQLRALWEEFEAGQTPEARFALALDRFMPQLHNYYTQGRSWAENGITADRVLERNECMAEGSVKLWECARGLLQDAVRKGFLSAGKEK